MSASTALVVFVIAIVAAVILGQKLKCNIGVIGICFAFLLGTMTMGKTIAKVISYFPTSLLFTMMIVTFFYGFASQNGAVKAISSRLIYAFRNHVKLLPVVLYFSVFFVATLGAGAAAAPVIMSPIAFQLAAEVGFSPVLAVISLSVGALAGGIQPWTSSGVLFSGIVLNTFDEATTASISWAYGITLMVIPTVFYLAVWLFYARRQKNASAREIKKPEPLNDIQKKTLILIGVMMVLIIVPVFANMFLPNPVTKWFASKFDIKVLCALGIVVSCALGLGNPNEVIRNNIPWPTIIMVCGMSMMINLAVETGIADLMGSWLGSNLPTMLVIPVIVLLAGLLSFITTGPAVIFPLFIPMFPALSATTGISVIALTAALFAGTGATGMSPFSQGGAMAITGCKDEKIRESLWSKQLLFAGIFLLFYIVFGFCGFFNAVASIFA